MAMELQEQYDKVYRYCYYKLHSVELAEDVTQEVFLRYIECESYKELGRPLAFLYTIARNLCIDVIRKNKTTVISENDLPALGLWEFSWIYEARYTAIWGAAVILSAILVLYESRQMIISAEMGV